MKISKFEDILAWQLSRDLTNHIYKSMSRIHDYSFKDQIQRASISVMNNIAEGFERKNDKEFSHFLKIAKGSCAEVRSMLYIADDMAYITKDDFKKFNILVIRMSQLLVNLIQSIGRRTART